MSQFMMRWTCWQIPFWNGKFFGHNKKSIMVTMGKWKTNCWKKNFVNFQCFGDKHVIFFVTFQCFGDKHVIFSLRFSVLGINTWFFVKFKCFGDKHVIFFNGVCSRNPRTIRHIPIKICTRYLRRMSRNFWKIGTNDSNSYVWRQTVRCTLQNFRCVRIFAKSDY